MGHVKYMARLLIYPAQQGRSIMPNLAGKIAVVTGASRGVGRGVALGLGEAGATVYITGRTSQAVAGKPAGTIYQTANDITQLGGRGMAIPCDHRSDEQVEAAFQQILAEQGHIDILVNN